MLQVLLTGDNSSTLYIPELDETYHSINGALVESRHVFIEAGLLKLPPDAEINILEVGLGTGLNALLTIAESKVRKGKLNYHALETRPLELEWITKLNMHVLPGVGSSTEILALHDAPWNIPFHLAERFTLTKHFMRLQDFVAPIHFDLVYFDAFAPDKQPELWTQEIFEKIYHMMHPGGILVTYSAKGEVRRNLKSCGFEVERIPGPPFKRHMTRARKN